MPNPLEAVRRFGPNSAVVKHILQVDIPRRGKTAEAIRVYLLSNNGSVKTWYKTHFKLR